MKSHNLKVGRPRQDIKTRSLSWACPKGFEFKGLDYKNKKLVFHKKE